jgi:hypothetical protein
MHKDCSQDADHQGADLAAGLVSAQKAAEWVRASAQVLALRVQQV